VLPPALADGALGAGAAGLAAAVPPHAVASGGVGAAALGEHPAPVLSRLHDSSRLSRVGFHCTQEIWGMEEILKSRRGKVRMADSWGPCTNCGQAKAICDAGSGSCCGSCDHPCN